MVSLSRTYGVLAAQVIVLNSLEPWYSDCRMGKRGALKHCADLDLSAPKHTLARSFSCLENCQF
jgi:hypothetical protein